MNPNQQPYDPAELARQQQASTHPQNIANTSLHQPANPSPPGPQAPVGFAANAPRMGPTFDSSPARHTYSSQSTSQMELASSNLVVHPWLAAAPIRYGVGVAQPYPAGSGLPQALSLVQQIQADHFALAQQLQQCQNALSEQLQWNQTMFVHTPPQSYVPHQIDGYTQQPSLDQFMYNHPPFQSYVPHQTHGYTQPAQWSQGTFGQPPSQSNVPHPASGLATQSSGISRTVQPPGQQGSGPQQPPIKQESGTRQSPVQPGLRPHQPPVQQGSRQPQPVQQGSGLQQPPVQQGSRPHQPPFQQGSRPLQPQSSTVTVNRGPVQPSAGPAQPHPSTTTASRTMPVITNGLIQPPSALTKPLPRDELLKPIYAFYGATERSELNDLNNKYHDELEDQDLPAGKRTQTERELLLLGQQIHRASRQMHCSSVPATLSALFNIHHSPDPATFETAKEKLDELKKIWSPHGWLYLCRFAVAVAQKRAGVEHDTELDSYWIDSQVLLLDRHRLPPIDWKLWKVYLQNV